MWSKYPPAEPEALRLLAPQRGLIATAEKQKQLQRHEAREATGFGKTKATAGGILPEFSKFDCLPGRAGGTPISLEIVTHVIESRSEPRYSGAFVHTRVTLWCDLRDAFMPQNYVPIFIR